MESDDAMFRKGNPPGCQPSDCCGDPSRHGFNAKAEAEKDWEAYGVLRAKLREKAQPLSGATVLQSGDIVLLCFGEVELSDEYASSLKDQLQQQHPTIRFSLITGVTGVLINRGNHDHSVREADDS